MLCAFDPVKYCSAAPRLSVATSRRSAWKPPRIRTLDFDVAVGQHALDLWILDEVVHQRGRRARRQQIEIAAGFAAAAQAADRLDRRAGGALAQIGDEAQSAVSCVTDRSLRPANASDLRAL